ncbi:MAG: hypothetical protein IKW87_08370, partial [Ruminococcus sp.]|nr:hypothetical protein [Ruminococcus sp.]
MKIKSKVSRLLTGAVSGAMLLSLTPNLGGAAPKLDANAAGACTINTGKTYQRIRGFGGMNHPEWQSYNAQNGAPGDMTA